MSAGSAARSRLNSQSSFSVRVNWSSVLVLRTCKQTCKKELFCFLFLKWMLILVMEATSPLKRSHAINTIDVFWAVGSSSLSLWAYLIRDWKYLQLAISIPALPLGIACIWLVGNTFKIWNVYLALFYRCELICNINLRSNVNFRPWNEVHVPLAQRQKLTYKLLLHIYMWYHVYV